MNVREVVDALLACDNNTKEVRIQLKVGSTAEIYKSQYNKSTGIIELVPDIDLWDEDSAREDFGEN